MIRNDILLLRRVSHEDLPAIQAYKEEFLAHGSSMDGTSDLRRFQDMEAWFDFIRRSAHRETCPPGRVPDIQFICIRRSDGRLVGMLDIRLEPVVIGARVFGHIGYSIRPSERRRGYAVMQLALAKTLCRDMGMKSILITCRRENLASEKTIRRNGGVLESEFFDETDGTTTLRYRIDLTT